MLSNSWVAKNVKSLPSCKGPYHGADFRFLSLIQTLAHTARPCLFTA